MGDVADRLRAEGLAAARWSNGPGERYAAHSHGYDKVIVVAAGSITFGMAGGAGAAAPDSGAGALTLATGDRLELPAGTAHDAIVSERGVTCLEAHLPAGRLSAVTRRAAGDW